MSISRHTLAELLPPGHPSLAQVGAPKRSKYGAKRQTVDGIGFDSKREASRYADLKLLLKAECISELKLHPWFDLFVNGVKICSYEADFSYLRDGKLVVEDAKGVRTKEYVIKKKLMEAVHGIKIQEV